MATLDARWKMSTAPRGTRCDALVEDTLPQSWRADLQCTRPAKVMYGPVAVCWQHDDRICRAPRPGDGKPPAAGEPWIVHTDDAGEVLAKWLATKEERGSPSD
jgi:hypothetical protein